MILTGLLIVGAMSAATITGDLSRYRGFQLGMDLPAIAKQTGMNPSQAKEIHRRPALIQELQWYPQPLGSSLTTEPVQDVMFSFYDGKLFQIVVNYDRRETEGLTAEDMVETLSRTYGMAATPPAPASPTLGRYGDQEDVLARWQDAEHRFELIRSAYGPSFRLVGVLRNLDASAQGAIQEATRLDRQEWPQREAARIASEAEAAKAKLKKARLVNKSTFRP